MIYVHEFTNIVINLSIILCIVQLNPLATLPLTPSPFVSEKDLARSGVYGMLQIFDTFPGPSGFSLSMDP